jgi:hypothetical protein
MAHDPAHLQALIAARLQSLGIAPDDPRYAAFLLHSKAAIGHSFDRSISVALAEPSTQPVDYALPASVLDAARGYIASARTAMSQRGFAAWAFVPPVLAESEEGRRLLALGNADKAHLVAYAYTAWTDNRHGGDAGAWRRVLCDLLRGKLELSDQQALALVKAAVKDGLRFSKSTPNQAVMKALQRHVAVQGLRPALKDALAGLRTRMAMGRADVRTDGRKIMSLIDAMLAHGSNSAGSEQRFTPKSDAWGKALEAKLRDMPFQVRADLVRLLTLASKGGENAKPSKGWLNTAAAELDRIGRANIGSTLLDVIECHEPGVKLALESQTALRALIWLAGMAATADANSRLEAYVQKCYVFSPVHLDYLSLVLGNATIHAFSLMPGTAGVGSLSRLKRKLRRPGELKTVDKAIASLAAARGMSSGELEEIGLPDYGFTADGTLTIPVGPARVDLAISDDCTVTSAWHGADGRPLSAAPKDVRDGHAAELKAFKAKAKEIGDTLKAQRLRIERLYLGEHTRTLDVWRARYLDEPLVFRLSRRLIWSFHTGKRWVAGLAQEGGISDVTGAALDLDPKTKVRLWHPMQSEPAHVLAWRRRLMTLGITQPFKQAHREIYVLTDAEWTTHVYSNRFAGHIVEQHLFRALCQSRSWNCPTFGGWDNGGGQPLKCIPDLRLQVEFWVDPVETNLNERYQFRHLSTDRVCIRRIGGEPVPLQDVDPVLFSELMRDADLFVGVSSIANDPTWADRGEHGFEDYWGATAFGELTATGETRHAVLRDLLPGLAIAPRCRLEARYLVVQGKLRTYRIHLGSANIQMEPNNQYLCIVADRNAEGSRVRLPFEGDATLSLILSKAFMLVDDDKIKDASIRSQIAG